MKLPITNNILDALEEARIVSFSLSKDKKELDIEEAYDNYFHRHLNKVQVAQFIKELQSIHDNMVQA